MAQVMADEERALVSENARAWGALREPTEAEERNAMRRCSDELLLALRRA